MPSVHSSTDANKLDKQCWVITQLWLGTGPKEKAWLWTGLTFLVHIKTSWLFVSIKHWSKSPVLQFANKFRLGFQTCSLASALIKLMFHRFGFPAISPDACCKTDAVPAEAANLAALIFLLCAARGLRTAALLTSSASTPCWGKWGERDKQGFPWLIEKTRCFTLCCCKLRREYKSKLIYLGSTRQVLKWWESF